MQKAEGSLGRTTDLDFGIWSLEFHAMTFGNSQILWLIPVVTAGMVLLFWWSGRMRQKLMTQFIQARLLPGLLAGVSATREKIRAACLILAGISLVLALAQPRWGYDLEEVRQRGLDIVVAVDTSKSMLAQDIPPNRLARAKLAALDLMQQAKSDRLGLVAFAGSAFLQCPLTVDDVVFRQSVEALDVNTIPDGGTALAEAIDTALKTFKEGDNYKVLVLFTDGEDHDSGALEAARKAAKAGLRIFTIGVGSIEGELLRVKGAAGEDNYIRDENGNVVKSHLNETLLQQIAAATPGGFYLPLRGADAIDTLYQRGLAPLPKSGTKEKWLKRARERYHWPLTFALMLLALEMLLPERRNPKNVRAHSGSRTEILIPKAIALLVFMSLPGAALASPSSALREYKSGKYDQALKDYEQSLQRKGDDPRLHFNAGTAAYRNQQFEQAAKHFDQAVTSPDLKMQQQAYYNLGNTLYHLGEKNPDPAKKSENWQQSLKQYESSLKLNGEDADARFNHEFVKKKLEELKQQQQQQQNQKNQDQKKQDQKESEQNQKQQQAKPAPGQKEQQPPRQASPQEQPRQAEKPEPDQKQEASEARSAGQMTPREAQRLLDSQKNDEMMLPVSRKEKTSGQERPIKDW